MKNISNQVFMVCQTPFQIWVASKIILRNKDSNFDILIISHEKSEKINYYCNKLKNTHANINIETLILKNKNIFNIILSLFILHLYLRNKKKYKTVYISGLNSLYIQKILSTLKFSNLKTYDDGVANIFKEGVFYNEKKSIKKSIIKFIYGINYNIEKIRQKTKLHYTIYKDMSNISKNIVYIGDNRKIHYNNGDTDKIKLIFLGQPYEEFAPHLADIIPDICKDLKIDFYFPHPRENFKKITTEYKASELIIEEYIDIYIKKNPSEKIIVISFISSALLSINNANVEKIALYDDIIFEKYKSLYNLFQKNNIKNIHIKNINQYIKSTNIRENSK